MGATHVVARASIFFRIAGSPGLFPGIEQMRIETLAVHAGHPSDPATGAVTPALHLSSTFERDPDGGYRAGHVYTRTSNPNRASPPIRRP